MSWRDHMTPAEKKIFSDLQFGVEDRRKCYRAKIKDDLAAIARIRNTCVQRAKRATHSNKESGW